MRRRPAATGGYIRAVEVTVPVSERGGYPLDLPALRNVKTLALDPRMTILVGENGSGKSTLVEGVAVAAGFNAEGGTINFNFRTQRHLPQLATHLRLVRNPVRPRTGFFLRAESFFNVATEIERLDEEGGGPLIGPAYGPRPLHEVSHGESFLAFLSSRDTERGLFILDEPEAALSFNSCLQLMVLMDSLIADGSQVLLATHSPVLAAFPGATILELGEHGRQVSSWEDLPMVGHWRHFLSAPDTYLRHLFASG